MRRESLTEIPAEEIKSEAERRLIEAATEYFQFRLDSSYQQAEDQDAWQQKLEGLKSKLVFAGNEISAERNRELVEQTIKAVYDLDRSLFLDDKAFDRLEESWKRFEIISEADAMAREDVRAQIYDKVDISEGAWKQERHIFSLLDGKVAGYSAYTTIQPDGREVLEVKSQQSFGAAGIGLAMVSALKKEAQKSVLPGVELNAFEPPSGLGNLGFRFKTGSAESITYQYDSVPVALARMEMTAERDHTPSRIWAHFVRNGLFPLELIFVRLQHPEMGGKTIEQVKEDGLVQWHKLSDSLKQARFFLDRVNNHPRYPEFSQKLDAITALVEEPLKAPDEEKLFSEPYYRVIFNLSKEELGANSGKSLI